MNKRKANLIILLNALVYPLFLLFFYSRLPETIPMQFSVSGQVNWSLPLNTALLAFIGVFVFYFSYIFFKHKASERYPVKDWLFALILPELYIVVLVIAMAVK